MASIPGRAQPIWTLPVSRDYETTLSLASCPVPRDITFPIKGINDPGVAGGALYADLTPPAIVRDKPPKHYVVVRTDMPLHVQMVQCCHACLIAGATFGVPVYAHLSLVSVPDADALWRVCTDLGIAGVPFYCFHEPDDGIGFSALCTEAIDGPAPPCLRKLPLWKAP